MTSKTSAPVEPQPAPGVPNASGELASSTFPLLKNNLPSFPIIGIGASAGGLAAFESFFSGMPKDVETGMAFVLGQHLAPDHKSMLPELIRRYTPMPVYEVEDLSLIHI